MQNPSALYRFETDADLARPRPGVLVVALGAFIDAGHIQSVLGGHLLETGGRVQVAEELNSAILGKSRQVFYIYMVVGSFSADGAFFFAP